MISYVTAGSLVVRYRDEHGSLKKTVINEVPVGKGHKYPYESNPVKLQGVEDEVIYHFPVTWEEKQKMIDDFKAKMKTAWDEFRVEMGRPPRNLEELNVYSRRKREDQSDGPQLPLPGQEPDGDI